ELLVRTKANGHNRDVLHVGSGGLLSASPVANNLPGAVPFAFTFDRGGNVVLTFAGPGTVNTFALNSNGTIALLDSVPTNQAATCWVVRVKDQLYASNTGSGSLTHVGSRRTGQIRFTATIPTNPGTVDADASAGGAFLYVRTGAKGIVDEFRVNTDGSLPAIGTVTVPNAVGGEGIVAV